MKLFIDLDNTICDFNKAVQGLGPGPARALDESTATEEDKLVMHKAINDAGSDFWANMSWAPDGILIWKIFKPFRPVLLSSPGTFRDADIGKNEWVIKNLPGYTLFLSNDKEEYVDPYETSILVDDNFNVIKAWEEAGGIGIHHTSAEQTERQFLEILWRHSGLDPRMFWG
jgi:hypothetical protein